MNLKIADRLNLAAILPRKGSVLELTLVDSIDEKIKLTAKEITDYEIKEVQQGEQVFTQWNQSKDKGIEVEFEKSEAEIIEKKLKELDDAKEMTKVLLPLYKMFNKK